MMSSAADAVAGVAARIASVLGPRLMRVIARFNKYVTNPIQRRWAPHLRHMAVIEHTGRRSGRAFRTPVMAFVEGDALSVVLNYGENSDWVRNVRSAETADVIHRGRRYTLTDPRILSVDDPELPAGVRAIGVAARSALHGTLTRA
jgi:deazaflavin-dependent oxidoreductase (nitroreductase family)